MLVSEQLVEVKIGSKNFQHYKQLGYDVKTGTSIKVPVEHLTAGSHAIVQIVCDICGCLIERPYYDYLEKHNLDILDIDVCIKCKNKKQNNQIV